MAEIVYDENQRKISELKKGESVEGIFNSCTICSVNNSFCSSRFEIILVGLQGCRPVTGKKRYICSLGVTNTDNCLLSY